jgi:GTP-binding protein
MLPVELPPDIILPVHLDAWKSGVVLVNKWDAIEGYLHDGYDCRIRRELNFMDYVPLLFLENRPTRQVLPLALQVQEEQLVRLATSAQSDITEGTRSPSRHEPVS